jgi:hypothetical protein
MGSQKIKKKAAASTPASMLPRQGAIPCLVLILLAIVIICLIVFFAISGSKG